MLQPRAWFQPQNFCFATCLSNHHGSLLPILSPLPMVGRVIWHKNKAMAILEEMIAQIRAAPTNILGWFEEDLLVAWKHIFPITPTNVLTGNLPLDHPSWGRTLNPWWKFLMDTPLISEKEAQDLNKLRRPLVMPYLDELGWLVQERRVIDFKGLVWTFLGNMPTMKLFQILNLVKRFDLLLCCREEIQGILNYLIVWKLDWVVSKDLLRRLGWSMICWGAKHQLFQNEYIIVEL